MSEAPETQDQFRIDPAEHDKIISAFYYPWYKGTDGIPGFTSEVWTSITPGDPRLGAYRSSSIDVINQHIKWSIEHGINSWIIGGMFNENNFRFLDSQYSNYIQYACLEGIPGKGNRVWDNYTDDPAGWFSERFQHMERNHFPRDNYLRVGPKNRPVLYIYAAANRTERLVSGIQSARERTSEDIYLIADVDMWRDPSRPTPRVGCREIAQAFDAITTYNHYQPFVLQRRPRLQQKENLTEAIHNRYRDWAIAAAEYNTDFIPNVFPGFNVTLAGERARDWPVIERSPDFFSEVCDISLDFLDPSLDMVTVTSFNEWPEYTAVEPTMDYGTTYLEIVASKLASSTPEYFSTENYPVLTFAFNKTVPPSELSENSDDDRELAFALKALELLDNTGSTLRRYDIGVWGSEPTFLEGAWGREEYDGNTYRWLGGETKQSKIGVDVDVSNTSSLVITGMPQVNNEITAEVTYDGNRIASLEFGRRRFDTYDIDVE